MRKESNSMRDGGITVSEAKRLVSHLNVTYNHGPPSWSCLCWETMVGIDY